MGRLIPALSILGANIFLCIVLAVGLILTSEILNDSYFLFDFTQSYSLFIRLKL